MWVASKAGRMVELWVSKTVECLVEKRAVLSVVHWAEAMAEPWGPLTVVCWALPSVDERVGQMVSLLVV